MELTASQAVMAQRLAVNLLAINRAEFQLSTDPRPENKKAVQATVESEYVKVFLERIQWVQAKIKRPGDLHPDTRSRTSIGPPIRRS